MSETDESPLPASTAAADLRRLCDLFPRDLALHRKLLLDVAASLEHAHANALAQAERIAAQADLLGRQRNAAKRCAEIAREEAASYAADELLQACAFACRRIADRIEGEVLTG